MIDVDDLEELSKEDLIEMIMFFERKLNKVEGERKNKHVTVRPRHILL